MVNVRRSSLAVRILLVTAAACFAVFAVLWLISYLRESSTSVEDSRFFSHQVVAAVQNAVEIPMAAGDIPGTHDVLARISKADQALQVFLTKPDGMISFSTDTASIGKNLKGMYGSALDSMLTDALAEKAERSEIVNFDGRQNFVLVKSIANEKSCELCHSADLTLLGALAIRNDIQWRFDRFSRSQLENAGFWAAGALLLLTLLFLVIRGAVLRRVSALGRVAEAVSLGDLTIDVDTASTDEIGALSRSFGRLLEAQREKERVANSIAEGDLTREVPVSSDRDKLGLALRSMSQSLREMIAMISVTASEVATQAKEISGSSTALSQGSSEQASSLEEVAASLEEVGTQARQNADQAKLASADSSAAQKSAESGNQRMRDLVAAMKRIAESSGEIQKAVKLIDNIAFQINLLALNANVEAARAGKYGKGFGVVADEVRNLAVRSAEAVKEVSRIFESSLDATTEGSKLAQESSGQLDDIVKGSSKVAQVLETIARSGIQQAEALDQVNTGLEQISQVTQENTANAEEGASAVDLLVAQAEKLRAMVSRFAVGDQDAPLPPARVTEGDRQ